MSKQIHIGHGAGRIVGTVGPSSLKIQDFLEPFTKDAVPIARWLRNHTDCVAVLNMVVSYKNGQGSGAGKELLASFLSEAAVGGAECVILIADELAQQAPGFDLRYWYQRRGFVAVTDTEVGAFMVTPAALGRAMRAQLFPAYDAVESEEEAFRLADQTLAEAEAAVRP